ncbi:DNA polymerase III subunit delta [Candidatus Pelagibacter sp. HIMB1593]|uniref:DNA polymerase III subunit delta n=1 Tax=Candidatus Pelagibacter sp. HIMB1593 TaxID=3413355 RepID=UPI003F844E66
MIIKYFEINKIDLDKNNLILFYGNNEGLKNETINHLIKENLEKFKYEEKEVLETKDNFLSSVLNKSLFEEKKIIIVRRATEKILKILNEINDKSINDIIIIIADNLEKKSKLRNFFEKGKDTICIPFYPDNEQTLSKLCNDFLKKKKIAISQAYLNQIVNKSSGDRNNLLKELEKIENFLKNGKKLSDENLMKLINLSEDYSISELVDNCLAKNHKKFITILNENNFTNEDCIIILRTFLNKTKKILKLSNELEKTQNIDLVISNAKPPIFWKDKDITKQQLTKWKTRKLKELIYRISKIELEVKKNINFSINLITDFLIEQSFQTTNN